MNIEEKERYAYNQNLEYIIIAINKLKFLILLVFRLKRAFNNDRSFR